jgi:hypothetical protein
LAELSGFLEIMQQQADRTEAKLEKQRQDAEAKLEAKLEAQKTEAGAQRRALETKMEALRDEAVEVRVRDAQLQLYGQQVTALQARFEALHAAKLLTDEELFALEDAIADAVEAPDDDDRVARMVALSARMASDASFSRQLRRKFAT